MKGDDNDRRRTVKKRWKDRGRKLVLKRLGLDDAEVARAGARYPMMPSASQNPFLVKVRSISSDNLYLWHKERLTL